MRIVHMEKEMPECAIKISMPREEVGVRLMLNCCRISRSQPVCYLRMYKFGCKPLTRDGALTMSKNTQSLYLNMSFLPRKILKSVRQLIANCTTLQWIQLRRIDLYDVEEDLTTLLRALVVHRDREKGTSPNQMDLRVELRHNNLSENFEKEMKKLWGTRRTRFMSFHCSQFS